LQGLGIVAVSKKKKQAAAEGVIATNRKARHEYEVIEEVEAGLVLRGTEVKSLRARQCSLVDSFAQFKDGELFLQNMHIAPYVQGNRFNVESKRPRKLLLHGAQLRRLVGAVAQKGLTLIPLQVYFSRQYAKVRLGLCRGKKAYDKRDSIRRRDLERDLDREYKAGRRQSSDRQ